MAHLYKSRLQNYAQKKSIAFPIYACETQGPPHNRLFRAKVTIDGSTFEGPEFCTTLKDAEHAAAKIALMSLSPEGIQQDDCLYKSLLQELAQKKGLNLPVYATNRAGQPHIPSFLSTVEIAGESYVGQEARTKKQAEMNAAKVAYSALTEGEQRSKNSAAFSDIQMVGPSRLGSLSLQTNVAEKKEPNLVLNANSMLTRVKDQANSSIVKEPVKTEDGIYWTPDEDIVKPSVTVAPVVIHQSSSKSAPNIIDSMKKLNIKTENPVTKISQNHQELEKTTTNKERIENLEAGFRGLQDNVSQLELTMVDRFNRLENAINKLTKAFEKSCVRDLDQPNSRTWMMHPRD